MYSPIEVETRARLQREEVARQVAAIYRGHEATRAHAMPRIWRQHLATALRAIAAWLAPSPTEPTIEPEPVVT